MKQVDSGPTAAPDDQAKAHPVAPESTAAQTEQPARGGEQTERSADRGASAQTAVEPSVGDEPNVRSGVQFIRSPYAIGFFGALGALTAIWLGQQIVSIGSVLILVVVSMFLAAGLNPLVEWFMRRGMRRSFAVVAVIAIVLSAIALFVAAIVPVIGEQVATLTRNAPVWLDSLLENKRVQQWNEDYDLISRSTQYIEDGHIAERAFGGVLGFGFAVLSALLNAFIVIILTLYFLASLPATKNAFYRLAPASRRERVTDLGDQVLGGIGGYVSGAFIVATCAGVSSLIFLFIVGLGEYAVALAFVVALLDVIPMIGATIGAVIVSLIGFAIDPKIGLACVIFYLIYQQVENYAIYPKIMSRAVDIPGAVIVIAALAGGSLFGVLGVLGALMAVPTAAAVLLLTREVFVRRQDQR